LLLNEIIKAIFMMISPDAVADGFFCFLIAKNRMLFIRLTRQIAEVLFPIP